MTNVHKMKAIVEAAGECWHEILSEQRGLDYVRVTCSCGSTDARFGHNHPSPTDLNELFRLAEKLDCEFNLGKNHNGYYAHVRKGDWDVVRHNTTPAALLNALYEAIS